MNKHWIATAVEYLTQSHEPVPHEINELGLGVGLTCPKHAKTWLTPLNFLSVIR